MTRSPPITAHLLRLRRLADGGESEGGPVEAVDVLGRQRVILISHGVVVHPLILPEPNEEADGEEDAGVPVDEDHNEDDNLGQRKSGGDQISKCVEQPEEF